MAIPNQVHLKIWELVAPIRANTVPRCYDGDFGGNPVRCGGLIVSKCAHRGSFPTGGPGAGEHAGGWNRRADAPGFMGVLKNTPARVPWLVDKGGHHQPGSCP